MKKYCLGLVALLYIVPAKAQIPSASIDVLHYGFGIVVNDDNNLMKGRAEIKLKALKGNTSVMFDLAKKDNTGKGMTVTSVTEAGKKLPFKQQEQSLTINKPLIANSIHTYTIVYEGIPSDGLIISTNKYGDRTFFGDNWLKRAHKWLPCVDDVADKATVDFTVTAPSHYDIVANGVKQSSVRKGVNTITKYSETVPISTKLMVFGAAKFAIEKSGDVNGTIPVYTYVYPQDKAVGFKSYACAPEILAVFIKRLGPFAYKKLANVQSKTMFGGMENAGAIFYYENSVLDKGIESLVAHEIGHQWFGDAVTEKSTKDVWLSEGFATFMANYFHEQKYGIDSLRKRLAGDKKTVINFEQKQMTPIVDTNYYDNPLDILNANSYQKGGWVLYMLRNQIGEDAFWKGLRIYYARYMNKNANTTDLRTEMEQASGQDLKQFFTQWLYTPGHPKLSIKWKYDESAKAIKLNFEQRQDVAYTLLKTEIKIGDKIVMADIRDKATEITLPCAEKPAMVTGDPNGILLAEFEVTEAK